MKSIHIFRAGKHTAMSGTELAFSEQDLQATAQAYDPALHEAPLVVGHPRVDAPAYGHVQALSVQAEDLLAQADQVEPEFAELVKAGRFKKVSASFYTPDSKDNPKPGVYYLRHVGFLGAMPPAIKGLKPIEFGEADEGTVTIEFAEGEDAALWAQFKRWLKGHMSSDESAFAEPPNPKQEEDPVTDKKTDEDLKAREADLEKREAEFAEREQRIADAERKATRQEVVDFVESLAAPADGKAKILPRDKEPLIAYLAGEDEISFAEGDETKKARPNEWLRSFLANLPPAIDYAERSQSDGKSVPDLANDAKAIASAAEDFMEAEAKKGRTITIAQAVAHVTREAQA